MRVGQARKRDWNEPEIVAALRCRRCGGEFHEPRASHRLKRVYCSRACMAAAYQERLRGAANPNFRNALRRCRCDNCGAEVVGYKDDARFCSQQCKHESEAISRMRLNARKDKNHDEIAAAYRELGCGVIELHQAGWGLPDLMVVCLKVWHAVEVKNPKTSYGRKGLNKRQQATNALVDGSIEVVSTVEGVVEMVNRWCAK